MSKRFIIISILAVVFSALSFFVLRESQKEYVTIMPGCEYTDTTGEIKFDEKSYVYDGKTYSIPQLAFSNETYQVLGSSTDERWIEVNLSEQKIYAWEGDKLFLESDISTGLPWWPTPQGEFHIWIKLRATKMEGGSGKYYYNLPNVPYVMYFEGSGVPAYRGYGLHGTYWHNDFGNPHSHGCVNLPTPVAEKLYYWTSPVLPDGKWAVRATPENPGTRIEIHK